MPARVVLYIHTPHTTHTYTLELEVGFWDWEPFTVLDLDGNRDHHSVRTPLTSGNQVAQTVLKKNVGPVLVIMSNHNHP